MRLAESPTEIEVRWLLDLAGIRADQACVQGILREIAGHSALLRRLLLTLAADAAPVRSQQLAIAALNTLWRDGNGPGTRSRCCCGRSGTTRTPQRCSS